MPALALLSGTRLPQTARNMTTPPRKFCCLAITLFFEGLVILQEEKRDPLFHSPSMSTASSEKKGEKTFLLVLFHFVT